MAIFSAPQVRALVLPPGWRWTDSLVGFPTLPLRQFHRATADSKHCPNDPDNATHGKTQKAFDYLNGWAQKRRCPTTGHDTEGYKNQQQ
jgi:hypothetical protein